MAIIRIRDENGKVQEILALRGEKGEKGQDGTVAFDELTEEQKASLKGDKGDRGDTGPKGDKGDGGTNVVQVTLTDTTSSHTPAQMKEVLDGGGVLVFNDGYYLYKLDDMAYCKKTEMTYDGKLIYKDTTVFEDGSAATYTEEREVLENDKTLTLENKAADAKAVGDRLVALEEKVTPTDSRYFDITDDGIISLKPQYRGSIISSADAEKYKYAISDNGHVKAGSENNELPENIVIPEVVNGIAVTTLPLGMFAWNTAVKSITIPQSITELPEAFARSAVNLHTVNGTENIKTLGAYSFYATNIEKANFPSLEDASNAKGAFRYCPNLILANIGDNVTTIPERMFGWCVKLTCLYGGKKVTSVGKEAFNRAVSLKKPVFLSNLQSIGDNAFRYCRIDYDWQSLKDKGCTFGTNATPLQYNATDFWSACTPNACETPLWSVFAQNDPKWANEATVSGENWDDNGCNPTSAAMIYSAFEGKYLSSPKEFVDAVKAVDESLMNLSPREDANLKQWLEALGYTVTIKSPLSTNLQAMYDALATGSLVILTVDGDTSAFDGGHAAVIYGVNEHGEVLVQDPQSYGYLARTYDVPACATPIQNISAANSQFMIVQKP